MGVNVGVGVGDATSNVGVRLTVGDPSTCSDWMVDVNVDFGSRGVDVGVGTGMNARQANEMNRSV